MYAGTRTTDYNDGIDRVDDGVEWNVGKHAMSAKQRRREGIVLESDRARYAEMISTNHHTKLRLSSCCMALLISS